MLGNILPPYHSLQELNLDWILTKIKNMLRFLPDDGAVGQVLRRTPHGAEWSDEQGAGGSVTSVNGMQGAVVLGAADVGALPDTYTAPVDSVNGQTGTVVLSIPSDTSDLTNGAGFVDAAGAAAAAPVQSVNGQTGAVVIPSDSFIAGTMITFSIDISATGIQYSTVAALGTPASITGYTFMTWLFRSATYRATPLNVSGGTRFYYYVGTAGATANIEAYPLYTKN